jgi:hypothetical protein
LPNRRRTAAVSVILVCLTAGCGWESREEIALRKFPYPYLAAISMAGDVGVTVTDEREQPLLSRGIAFVDGGELVHTVGQDAACSLVDYGRQLFEHFSHAFATGEWTGRAVFANHLIEPWRPGEGGAAGSGGGATAGGPTDALAGEPRTDGSASPWEPDLRRYSFRKYAGRWGRVPGVGSGELERQLSEGILLELKAKGGWMLVDVRLGESESDASPWTPGSLDALLALEEEHREGRLYVTTPGRLLAANLIHRHLDWEATRSGDGVEIRVRGVRDEAGGLWVPTVDDLQGLTFYTPAPASTRLFIAGEEIEGLVTNPADHTRRESVSIPLADDRFPRDFLPGSTARSL